MHLKSEIIVPQHIEDVSKFFFEPSNLSKWDRSVAKVIPASSIAGSENTFVTVAPAGMKMGYRVLELEYGKSTKILLTDSKMFREAIWHFEFAAVREGTKITCHIYFKPRLKYVFLSPILWLNKHALLRDLEFLKIALEKNTDANCSNPVVKFPANS